ncbi:hypothetical protein ACFC39_37805, partial [Streptomyces sp. NPDC056049]
MSETCTDAAAGGPGGEHPVHRVVVAVFPDVDLLDVTGPAEVFALANREAGGRARYRVRLAAPGGAGEVRTSAGVRLVAARRVVVGRGAVGPRRVPGAGG